MYLPKYKSSQSTAKKTTLGVDVCVFSQNRGSALALCPRLSADWYEEQDDEYSAANRIDFPSEAAFEVEPQPALRNSTPSMMLQGMNSA